MIYLKEEHRFCDICKIILIVRRLSLHRNYLQLNSCIPYETSFIKNLFLPIVSCIQRSSLNFPKMLRTRSVNSLSNDKLENKSISRKLGILVIPNFISRSSRSVKIKRGPDAWISFRHRSGHWISTSRNHHPLIVARCRRLTSISSIQSSLSSLCSL